MLHSFYTETELRSLGLHSFGKNVLISRKASVYNPKKMKLGNNVRIDDFCILSGKIIIGNYIHIGAGSYLFGGEVGITMEDFSGIAPGGRIFALCDDFTGNFLTNPTVPKKFLNLCSKQVKFERHALLGADSVILPGVTLHEGVAVGAMSLITKSLESWSIYAGTPLQKIKERSKKLLEMEKKLLLGSQG